MTTSNPTRAELQARMNATVATWVRGLDVTPVSAEAHARAQDVLIAVEVSTPEDAALVAAALRLACSDVQVYDADGTVPAMVTASASEEAVARLARRAALRRTFRRPARHARAPRATLAR